MGIITSDNPNGAGRPTDLTQDVFDKIKELILDGYNLREISNLAQINEGTLYQWHARNHLNLADKIEGWKRDRKLMLAERNLEAIMGLGISDKDTLRTVADVSKFVAETLGKQTYSKKTETDVTTNGESLQPILVKFLDAGTKDNNNS